MLFSKEYVGYLARQATNRLIKAEMIETADVNATAERVNQFMLEELSLEDRIKNLDVAELLEQSCIVETVKPEPAAEPARELEAAPAE